jgi:glutaminyl-peptide cyclotransferase
MQARFRMEELAVKQLEDIGKTREKNSRGVSRSWRKLMPLIVLLLTGVTASLVVLSSTNSPAEAAPPVSSVEVVQIFPHDSASFVQGLVVYQGEILEGTGQYQKSRLRRLQIPGGAVVKDIAVPDDVFGEGITVWNNQILQLTWKNGYMIVYDAETFERKGFVRYRDIDPSWREGWGITHDGQHLIVSDGTATLRFIDPVRYQLIRTVVVRNGWQSLKQLNELEFVNGEIFANVWYRDEIARIDPQSGSVKGWLDLAPLKPKEVRFNREAVLNGIAWDPAGDRLYVTGKNWPALFQIRITDSKTRPQRK